MKGQCVTVLPTAPVEEAVLFSFDDVSIPFTHNLRLTMQAPQKHPANPVLGRGPAGTPDDFGVQFYGSIVRDEGRFKLWYVAGDEGIRRKSGTVLSWRPAYAESPDGIHWERPALGLVEYKGSTANNLVRLEPAPLAAINLKVLVEPDDPDPARRYKMSVHTWWCEGQKRGKGTLAPLFSADGLRWRLAIPGTPVNGLLPAEEMILPRYHFEAAGGLYRWGGFYYATGQTARDVQTVPVSGREITTFRSADFVHWSPTKTLAFVREGQHRAFPMSEGEEAHEEVSVWERGNVLLGLYGLWHGAREWQDRTMDLGFLISNDGLHFREPLTEWTCLRRGEDGAWDEGGLLQGQGFENVGDLTYIYYGAWDLRVGFTYTPRGGLGLATLERDRFGALAVRDPGDRGELVTAPWQAGEGARLWVNAAGLGADAWLRVELLDAREQPLPGYSGEQAALVRQAGLRSPVSWGGRAEVSPGAGPCRARVTFEGPNRGAGQFYALYIAS